MPALLTDSSLPVPDGVADEIERQFAFLAAPGPTLTGAERVAVAAAARAARAGSAGPAASPLVRAAQEIAVRAWEIDRSFLDALLSDGLTIHQYVEVLGIVARTTAIDTAVRGLGAPEVALPTPIAGEPTGEIDPEAKTRSALIPTVGSANPVTVLNALPPESAHQESLSDALYMSYVQMGDHDIDLGLHRTQIELVAARTSSVNECVY